jgi:hypothetical protein
LNLVGSSDITKLIAVNLKTTSFPSLTPREKGSAYSPEEAALRKYQKQHKAVVPKIKALMKAQRFSTVAAEKIKSYLGVKLILFNKTRWNSSFNTIQQVVELSHEKKEAFQAMCNELHVKTFDEDNLRFMWEYVLVSSFKVSFSLLCL